MTSFDEVQFPTDIDYGSSVTVGFKTTVLKFKRGAENRVMHWEREKRTFTAKIDKAKSGVDEIVDFFFAREGAEAGFRYKDWFDFTSNPSDPTSESSYPYIDQIIGAGDASATTFLLKKVYEDSAGYRHTRWIEKPVTGTVRVAFNGVEQMSGWTVDTETGIVTFSGAVPYGVMISAGFEFDVPVFFDPATDIGLIMSHDSSKEVSVVDLGMIEIPYTELKYEELDMGLAKEWGSKNIRFEISPVQARVHMFTALSSSAKVVLPPADGYQPAGGMPMLAIINEATSHSPAIVDFDNNLIGWCTAMSSAANGGVTLVGVQKSFDLSTDEWVVISR